MARPDHKQKTTEYQDVVTPELTLAIVVSEFNQKITDRLLSGALEFFLDHGMQENQIRVYWVPGAFEIPGVSARLARKGKVQGIVTLGAVIRGETTHYDVVCQETARGVMNVSLEALIPVTFGVLTCDNVQQAFARTGGEHGNKGWDCAKALLDLLRLHRQLEV